QKCADRWSNVLGRSEADVAELIRRDGIDILVDLTMHMGQSDLCMFARKPAPVQVTWLAYPGSTGLRNMDYRLTDSYMDPPVADTSCYSEQSVRLPNGWFSYDPLADVPAASAPTTAPICFGSFNNICKLNESTFRLWSRVMQAVPDSRLLILADLGAP